MSRLRAVLALLVVWLLVAVTVGLLSFRTDSRVTVIGAHTTTVSPTFDGYATLDFGPLVPRFRVATDSALRLGVLVDVGDTDVASLDELIQRDALIASQPAGEVREVRATVTAMAWDAAVRGAGAGVLAVLLVTAAWLLVGSQRRAELSSRARRTFASPHPRPLVIVAGVTALAALALAATIVPGADAPESASGRPRWTTVSRLFPDLSLNSRLAAIEVSSGSATRGGAELIDSAVSTYRDSVDFYGALADRVADVAPQLHTPQEGDTVALLVSDRHDNIGMDPVALAVTDAAGASMLLDAGDDTSSGGSWETFSINSLANMFDGYEIIAAAGNHDFGEDILQAYDDAGFTVLAGEPVTVDGITFLGDADPRSSGLTAIQTPGSETVEEQSARLAATACEAGDVSVVLVHSPTTGLGAVQSGCVDMVLSGHLHRQVGPEKTYSPEGRSTTAYTTGTTGGAAYAFALGSALRREAQVTLVTFRDGRPVGLQPVRVATDGTIEVADYVPVGVGLGARAGQGLRSPR
ncbi:hypothetical protein BH18ACT8_BH18ACT8_15080 [soil metagenome]